MLTEPDEIYSNNIHNNNNANLSKNAQLSQFFSTLEIKNQSFSQESQNKAQFGKFYPINPQNYITQGGILQPSENLQCQYSTISSNRIKNTGNNKNAIVLNSNKYKLRSVTQGVSRISEKIQRSSSKQNRVLGEIIQNSSEKQNDQEKNEFSVKKKSSESDLQSIGISTNENQINNIKGEQTFQSIRNQGIQTVQHQKRQYIQLNLNQMNQNKTSKYKRSSSHFEQTLSNDLTSEFKQQQIKQMLQMKCKKRKSIESTKLVKQNYNQGQNNQIRSLAQMRLQLQLQNQQSNVFQKRHSLHQHRLIKQQIQQEFQGRKFITDHDNEKQQQQHQQIDFYDLNLPLQTNQIFKNDYSINSSINSSNQTNSKGENEKKVITIQNGSQQFKIRDESVLIKRGLDSHSDENKIKLQQVKQNTPYNNIQRAGTALNQRSFFNNNSKNQTTVKTLLQTKPKLNQN